MGVYSTNRVFDDTEYGFNESDFELTYCDPDFGHLMESVIAIRENDQMMFESVIQCDFIAAMNEQCMSVNEAEEANSEANTVKKKKISEKISALFKYIGEQIRKAIANMMAKIQDLVRSDKKLYEKLAPTLTMDNLSKFIGIDNFALPKNIDSSFYSLNKVQQEYDTQIKKITDATTREDVDSAYAEYDQIVVELENKLDNISKDRNMFGTSSKTWKPSSSDLEDLKSNMKDPKKAMKDLKDQAKNVSKKLNEMEKKAKENLKSAKKDGGDELEVYKLNKIYSITSRMARVVAKFNSAFINAKVKQQAAYRRAFIICGRAAYKASKKATKKDSGNAAISNNMENTGEEAPEEMEESVMMDILSESSDLYVYEMLGY